MHGRMLLGSAFDGKRIEFSTIILDARLAATQEPHSPAIVEITGIAGAMPNARPDAELGFLVANAIEIAAQNVIAMNDDFAGLIRPHAVFGEVGFGIIGNRTAPLLAK